MAHICFFSLISIHPPLYNLLGKAVKSGFWGASITRIRKDWRRSRQEEKEKLLCEEWLFELCPSNGFGGFDLSVKDMWGKSCDKWSRMSLNHQSNAHPTCIGATIAVSKQWMGNCASAHEGKITANIAAGLLSVLCSHRGFDLIEVAGYLWNSSKVAAGQRINL